MKVDLPAPFSPQSAWISPGAQIEADVLKRDDARELLDDVLCFEDDRIHAPLPARFQRDCWTGGVPE